MDQNQQPQQPPQQAPQQPNGEDRFIKFAMWFMGIDGTTKTLP